MRAKPRCDRTPALHRFVRLTYGCGSRSPLNCRCYKLQTRVIGVGAGRLHDAAWLAVVYGGTRFMARPPTGEFIACEKGECGKVIRVPTSGWNEPDPRAH